MLHIHTYIDGFMQERSSLIANAMELTPYMH